MIPVGPAVAETLLHTRERLADSAVAAYPTATCRYSGATRLCSCAIPTAVCHSALSRTMLHHGRIQLLLYLVAPEHRILIAPVSAPLILNTIADLHQRRIGETFRPNACRTSCTRSIEGRC